MARTLTIREANRLARDRAKVSVDPEDGRLWRVERPGSVQAHEPMAREAWLAFLNGGENLAALRYAEYRQDVDRLLEFLTQELRKHAAQAKADARNFGYAGDLYRLRSCLVEAVASFRGVDIEDVERHLDGQADDLVLEADACPKCGERNVDKLVWQDNGKVKCTTCGMRYRPVVK